MDGLVLATAARHDSLVRRCILEGVPVVLVNRAEEGGHVPEVVNDDFLSMKLAVEHLVNLGHKRIAHIAGPANLATGFFAYPGLSGGYAAAPFVRYPPIVESTEFGREAGRAACLQLLKQNKKVTAIVAANDLIALGCYDALADQGLHCPNDISIVGHNDMPLVDMLNPPLTTVRIQHREMGRQAARLLLERISSPNAAPRTHHPAPRNSWFACRQQPQRRPSRQGCRLCMVTCISP
ncbi:substrate-binding domain-containing protein [Undibacterium arcticum]